MPFRPPSLILTPLETIGATNTPLAMLVLGGFLAKLNPREAVSDGKALLSYAGRLVICPVVCAVILVLLPVSEEAQTAMFIISAMPASTSLGLQAALYGSDGPYAAQLVAMSTLLSVVSIPLVTALFFWLQALL
ncbi:MAG: AEC family transporter [Eubacteriales bacterium]